MLLAAISMATCLSVSPVTMPAARLLPAANGCLLHVERRLPRASVGMGVLDAMKGSWERLTDWRVARASHLLLKRFDDAALEQMAEWKAEIGSDPEKFAAMAREHSQCPSRVRGGDLGFFTRGKMVKEFDNVVFTKEPGSVYGPVRTDFGNHLIFLHSCREPTGR